MQRQANAIKRLALSILRNGGIAGRFIVSQVHKILWSFANRHDEVKRGITPKDCPEGDPNCDPPGGDS